MTTNEDPAPPTMADATTLTPEAHLKLLQTIYDISKLLQQTNNTIQSLNNCIQAHNNVLKNHEQRLLTTELLLTRDHQ